MEEEETGIDVHYDVQWIGRHHTIHSDIEQLVFRMILVQ